VTKWMVVFVSYMVLVRVACGEAERAPEALTYLAQDKYCGPTCLAAGMRLLGVTVPYEQLVESCDLGSTGTSFSGLRRAAMRWGVKCVGVEADLGFVRRHLPAVVAVNNQHFFLLVRDFGSQLRIIDPPRVRIIRESELQEVYTGKALLLGTGSVPSEAPLWAGIALGGTALLVLGYSLLMLRRKCNARQDGARDQCG